MKRFYDDKLQGVTQPSQRRYVHYFEDLLVGKLKLDARYMYMYFCSLYTLMINFIDLSNSATLSFMEFQILMVKEVAALLSKYIKTWN